MHAVDAEIKKQRDSPEWWEKVNNNEKLLTSLATNLGMKSSLQTKLNLVLWGCTHIIGIHECEKYWLNQNTSSGDSLNYETSSITLFSAPSSDKMMRNELTKLLSGQDMSAIEALACWVWTRRFVSSGFQVEYGGWILLDMIQVCSVLASM
jgi:hypothetical protein